MTDLALDDAFVSFIKFLLVFRLLSLKLGSGSITRSFPVDIGRSTGTFSGFGEGLCIVYTSDTFSTSTLFYSL